MSEPIPMRDFALLLRAGALSIPAIDLLYGAAGMLKDSLAPEDIAHNKAVFEMTARLLNFSTNKPEVVERVLRNLPRLD